MPLALEGTHCHHLSNYIEPSVYSGDALNVKLLSPLVIFGRPHRQSHSEPSTRAEYCIVFIQHNTAIQFNLFLAKRPNSICAILPSISWFVLLLVLDAPKITCHPASAYIDDHDINIRCDIMSNPSVLTFYWTLDSNGTMLKEDETLAEYQTTATVHLL